MRPSAPSPVSLRRVLVLKNIAVVGQTLAVLVVAKGMGMPLPFAVIGTVLLVLNLLTWVRLKLLWEVREAEVFAQLLLDVLLLSGLLYLAGGATNPFVLLLLLPLTIAAATLAMTYAWTLAAAIVACYTLLMFVYIPLPHFHIDHTARLDSGAWLMWLGFVLRGTAAAPAATAGTAHAHRLGSSFGASRSCEKQGQHPRRMFASTLRARSHAVGRFDCTQLLKFHGTIRAEVFIDWHAPQCSSAPRAGRNALTSECADV